MSSQDPDPPPPDANAKLPPEAAVGAPGAAGPHPTPGALFVAFAGVSIFSFGGVLAWARRMLVDDKHWMTPEEFNDILALCQFLPGPNIVNVCAVFGMRVGGIRGALACLTGLLGPSVAMMIAAGMLYRAFGALPELRGVLAGLAAAAAGMIIATTVQIATPLVRGRVSPAHGVALAAFLAVGVLRLSLPLVLVVLVPVSIGFAWGRKDER